MNPSGLAVDSNGVLYIADTDNHLIKKYDGSTLVTIAGNGSSGFAGDMGDASDARFNTPIGLVCSETHLYICDSGNHRIRRIDLVTNIITTFCGTMSSGDAVDGTSISMAALNLPSYITLVLDDDDNEIFYVSDVGNKKVKKLTVSSNQISTTLDLDPDIPAGLTYRSGLLYICKPANSVVITYNLETDETLTFAGTGLSGYIGDGISPASLKLAAPTDIHLDSQNNLYIADEDNGFLEKIGSRAYTTKTYREIASSAGSAYVANATLSALHVTSPPINFAPDNLVGFLAPNVRFSNLDQVFAAGSSAANVHKGDGDWIYISTTFPAAIFRYHKQNGQLIHVAGTGEGFEDSESDGTSYGIGGTAVTGRLGLISGLAVDGEGNVYFSDSLLNVIVKIDATTNVMSILAGHSDFYTAFLSDSSMRRELSFMPYGLDIMGNFLYVATQSFEIEGLDPSMASITQTGEAHVYRFSLSSDSFDIVCGDGTDVTLDGSYENVLATLSPMQNCVDIAVMSDGDVYLYEDYRIRKIEFSTGLITTFAGNGMEIDSTDGMSADETTIGRGGSLALDVTSGDLYAMDISFGCVRRIDAFSRVITTFAGNKYGDYPPAGGDGLYPELAYLNGNNGIHISLSDGLLYIADDPSLRLCPLNRSVEMGMTCIDFAGGFSSMASGNVVIIGSLIGNGAPVEAPPDPPSDPFVLTTNLTGTATLTTDLSGVDSGASIMLRFVRNITHSDYPPLGAGGAGDESHAVTETTLTITVDGTTVYTESYSFNNEMASVGPTTNNVDLSGYIGQSSVEIIFAFSGTSETTNAQVISEDLNNVASLQWSIDVAIQDCS